MKDYFLLRMWHADFQSSVNSPHRITYDQPCLVFMHDSPFSINTILSAFLSPEAIETLSGLQSFSLSLLIFLGLIVKQPVAVTRQYHGKKLGINIKVAHLWRCQVK